MDHSKMTRITVTNDTLEDSMQFNTNYSIIDRDEQSFIRRNNIQTTQSSLIGSEMGDISWMPPDEISLFQSKIMNSTTSRLPPEGAERRNHVGTNRDNLDISNLSDCSQYKELLQLVNKYDLEDISISEVPDKILPPAGGRSYRDLIYKQRTEGRDMSVPSTEQLLAVLKESEGLTPTKIYDRIMESSYPRKADQKLSESDTDITTCGWTQLGESSVPNQTCKVPAPVDTSRDSYFDFKQADNTLGDSSFVPMSNSILDRDEKSILEKYGGLMKQADITCPGDQPTLPWSVSNVTIFDLETTGSLPPRRRLENSARKLLDGPAVKSTPNDTSQLDDLADRLYALSPSTSFSSISKMILDSNRARDVSAAQKNVTG